MRIPLLLSESWRAAHHGAPIQAWSSHECNTHPSAFYPSFVVAEDSDSDVSLGDDNGGEDGDERNADVDGDVEDDDDDSNEVDAST
ncbi:hypothetical protein BgiMline_026482, partial [Biomphalaria glabrata]